MGVLKWIGFIIVIFSGIATVLSGGWNGVFFIPMLIGASFIIFGSIGD